MSSITTAFIPVRLFGAVLALTLIAAIAVVVTLTAGPTQAQSTTYEDPHPCGPGFDEFYALPDYPVDQVNTGHFAIFDAYYDLDSDEPHRPTEEDEAWAGLMGLNFCPPELVAEDDGFGNDTTTRSQANIDINNTVFHVDQAQHTLTADEAAAYPFLGDAGDAVYWLRVGDDPNTSATEQASDFRVSFSTALFDAKYWHLDGSPQPLWYEVEAEHELGVHPRVSGQIYIFDAQDEHDPRKAIWNSGETDTGIIPMEPGQYRNLQWVFTQPGTYEIEVHLNGHVRRDDPGNLPDGELWHPISEKDIVTSDVKTYIFRVGPLTLNEQPMFRVDRSVRENPGEGAAVGKPVPVAGAGSDTLTYALSGDGHENFVVDSVAEGAQIRVASGAALDYETRNAYRLVLSVSDGKNREGDADDSVDHTITVNIQVEDAGPTISLSVRPTEQDLAGDVHFTGVIDDFPESFSHLQYTLYSVNEAGARDGELEHPTTLAISSGNGTGTEGTLGYQLGFSFFVNNVEHAGFSNVVTVHWTRDSS